MQNKDNINYKMLDNYIKNLSHAYLFVINDNPSYEELILYFAYKLISDNEKERETITNQIKNNTHSEVRVIKAEGMWIKKEQMYDLKKEFNTKALNANKRVYIIHDVEKLNDSSSNSILKFLEEPEENVVALLTTNNINLVLNTIVSRCQKINLLKSDNVNLNYDISYLFSEISKDSDCSKDDYINAFLEKSIRFITVNENIKLKTICFSKEYFHSFFKKREEIEIFFQTMIMFYNDVLNYIVKGKTTYFANYSNEIKEISSKNNQNTIIKKINIISQKKDLIKNNINVNLLIDSLIFDLEGVF